jgi:transcriptional regulator with XRE-family HTH domain
MSEELQKEIGETIRLLRLLLRLSYAELMERSGVSSTYQRQVERGERDIGMDKLTAIARGLGFDLPTLLPGEGRSALAQSFAEGYAKAPEAVQEAIVSLLAQMEGSPRRDAILSLVPADFAEITSSSEHPGDPSSDKTER